MNQVYLKKFRAFKIILTFIVIVVNIGCSVSNSEEKPKGLQIPIFPFSEGKQWVYETKIFINGELKENEVDTLKISKTINEYGMKGWLIDTTSSIRFSFGQKVFIGMEDSVFTSRLVWLKESISLEFVFPKTDEDKKVFQYWLAGDVPVKREIYQSNNLEDGRRVFFVDETSEGSKVIKIVEGIGITEINETYINTSDNEIIVSQVLINY